MAAGQKARCKESKRKEMSQTKGSERKAMSSQERKAKVSEKAYRQLSFGTAGCSALFFKWWGGRKDRQKDISDRQIIKERQRTAGE